MHHRATLPLLMTLLTTTACNAPHHAADDLSANQHAAHSESWYTHHRAGWAAINAKDYPAARNLMLLALEEAEHFSNDDRRLAETLDDLGLIYYRLNDDRRAEEAQARAACELLLARGPAATDVKVFLTRLGYIYRRQNRPDDIKPLLADPWRIMNLGYLPLTPSLAARLDGLIYEYERLQNPAAVTNLTELAQQTRGQPQD